MANGEGICPIHKIPFDLREGCPRCLADKQKQEGHPAYVSEIKLLTQPGPGADLEVKKYYQEAQKLQEYAEAREITSVEDIKVATNDLSIIARLKKNMETKRREYLEPHQAIVKAINEFYKAWMQPIETADRITRDKILAFNKIQAERKVKEEEINRERIDAAQKEMELKGEVTEPVDLVEVSPGPAKRVSTGMGTTGMVKIRKYRVENFAELPDQYKIENSVLLNKVVKAGIPSIPGVEIYEEEIIRVIPK